MATKKPRPEKQQTVTKNQKYAMIVEEVETFEDLAPRMHELLSTTPPGTRIYLRVRDREIMN